MPVSIEIEVVEERRGEGKEKVEDRRGTGRKVKNMKMSSRKEEEKRVISWNKEDKEKYKKNTEDIGWLVNQGETSVDKCWEKLKDLVMNSMIYKVLKIRKKSLGHKDWWNRSCTRKKRDQKEI